MARLFGTDGVRGLANDHLTVELSVGLAQAAAIVLARETREHGRRPRAVVARDPRISGEFLAAAVSAGLASSGVDVLDAGVIPTPAAAFLTADIGADFGVMISASHNAAPDNGIKFFARGGRKLPDELEDEIELLLASPKLAPTGAGVGRISRFADAEDRYALHLLRTIPTKPDGTPALGGLRVVLDCANGAAAGVSPQVFTDAGAEVTVIGNEPDGLNINDGVGSTHLGRLRETVVALGADIGIAHDGDADRCLAVDADGNVVDGDQIMAIIAISMQQRGLLRENTLVATVMSNLGLKIAMRDAGITMHETKVGDRYVLAELNARGLALGGEQSGHVILTDYATTGDGILTGLHLASVMSDTGKTLRELADVMRVYPQVLINVRGVRKDDCADDEHVQAAVRRVVDTLGDTGRVLLRPSGTEPLVRVMVEAADHDSAQRYAEELADVVRESLAL
ncbi:phosphoglucosamine mutase [Pseudoclavibacter chungangensis]|uniref:Phosphoglucosamine mutase n=1 Tax=Pseudoclavibacter chungangensis TaxID=587635 RepID=A0A7J5C121_9MICO|nr:phosphoglucosamine mutase [Pseudoclavibacter chungangensis]KAB1662319.1 phosphoglucosamine mutase [Pseudoclavibacter chungangensis]NYJ65528.1 phosphoglucosamine mutase [Pseudoclavibacter chungangensis]